MGVNYISSELYSSGAGGRIGFVVGKFLVYYMKFSFGFRGLSIPLE